MDYYAAESLFCLPLFGILYGSNKSLELLEPGKDPERFLETCSGTCPGSFLGTNNSRLLLEATKDPEWA